MDFLKKDPQNVNEWKRESEHIQVVLGVFSNMITESTRAGVLLALNDAFGKK